MFRFANLMVPVVLAVFVSGCSPAGTAVKIGMKLVGKVVADEETDKLGQKLIGQRASAADAELGQPVEVWRDVNNEHSWRLYKVKLDVLDKKRTVVECAGDQIVAVEMVERHGSEVDIPLELIYYAKVKGKSPRECEAALGLGRPLATARSTMTRELIQIYDAQLIKELTSPHNLYARFDSSDRCHKVDLVAIEASTN